MPPRTLSLAALTAPLLMFGYGLFWLVDGLDGSHGPGFAWYAGHSLFFLSFLAYGALLLGLRQVTRGPAAGVLTGIGLAGVAAFLWVIATDLVPALDDAVETPDLVMIAGPLLFEVGAVGLLILAVRRRLVPWWSPVVVTVGFLPIAVSLNMLSVAAAIILAGLWPLAGAAVVPAREETPPEVSYPEPVVRGVGESGPRA
jgi:hypothetical protein